MNINDIDTLVEEAKARKAEKEKVIQEGVDKTFKEAVDFIKVLQHAKSLDIPLYPSVVLNSETMKSIGLNVILNREGQVLGIGYVYLDDQRGQMVNVWLDEKSVIHKEDSSNLDLKSVLYEDFKRFKDNIETRIREAIVKKYW